VKYENEGDAWCFSSFLKDLLRAEGEGETIPGDKMTQSRLEWLFTSRLTSSMAEEYG